MGRHGDERAAEHDILIHVQRLVGEGGNKAYILKPYHMTVSILYIECAFKRGFVFNPKEVFLKRSERLDPKGLASSYRYEMETTERSSSVCVDPNRQKHLFPG
jgi:hypothetical protein